MSIVFSTDAFKQAKALVSDMRDVESSELTSKEDVGLSKILKAREQDPDFELGLAVRICGDNENYPYRSSYYLTRFFEDLGFPFAHDGSTRRFWVRDQLLKLSSKEILNLIRKGLFRKRDFQEPKFRIDGNRDKSESDFLQAAVKDFRSFVDESIRASEYIEFDQFLNLNTNLNLVFQTISKTKDSELNELIEDARSRFVKPGDQNIALEKLWDAFERMKTYYGLDDDTLDKKKSSQKLIDKLSTEIDKEILGQEFKTLTKIGNEYRIRHHEVGKKQIRQDNQVSYLFFRMLALMDLALSELSDSDQN